MERVQLDPIPSLDPTGSLGEGLGRDESSVQLLKRLVGRQVLAHDVAELLRQRAA